MSTIEIWKPVVGYEGLYEVSNRGRVHGIKRGGILKPHLCPKGYVRVRLTKNNRSKNKRVHRVILETFVGPCPEGHEGAHLDGQKQNNWLSNLAWKTPVENSHDKILHGTNSECENHGAAKLSNEDVVQIRRLRKAGLLWRMIHERWPQGPTSFTYPSRHWRNLLCLIGIACLTACASRVETVKTFPPAADLRPAPEPTYPDAALDSEEIEKAWWNSVLLWGRGEHSKVVRVCNWARDLKMELPAGYCTP